MTEIGTLGGPYSGAYGINDSGKVVGYAYTAGSGAHAFLYDNGTMTDLGTLGGSSSDAFAINNRGQIVGYANDSQGYGHAFLYDNGQMTAIDAGLGSSHSEAHDINENGSVVGNALIWAGDVYHAFLYENGSARDWAAFPVFLTVSQPGSTPADK